MDLTTKAGRDELRRELDDEIGRIPNSARQINKTWVRLKEFLALLDLADAGEREWRPITEAPDGDLDADVWAYASALKRGSRYPNAIRRDGVWRDCGGNVLNWGSLDADGEPQYWKVTHWMPIPGEPPPPARAAANDVCECGHWRREHKDGAGGCHCCRCDRFDFPLPQDEPARAAAETTEDRK